MQAATPPQRQGSRSRQEPAVEVDADPYVASTIKRARRSKVEMEDLRERLWQIVADGEPMTVRQVFYQAVSRGLVAKTEGEYNSTVVRLLGEMRLAGDISFDWIIDNTRWMRKPRTHSSLRQALRDTARTYRRAVWDDQDVYVEIWTEKDAIAGLLLEATRDWDVPIMVSRGFSSLSFLHSAAETIEAEDKPAYLYYFGDHDPSGRLIPQVIERRLREFAPMAEIHFEQIAVTPGQILAWNLPTRPTKRSGTHSRDFEGDSIEVDAIPPDQLRVLAEECVRSHIDWDVLVAMETVEAEERASLEAIIANLPEAG